MSDKRMERRGLGRGLSALMADVAQPATETPDAPRRPDMRVPIERVEPNPNQPRRDFAEEALAELADSIREKAHKWLGQLTSVSKASEDFKLYFLVGEPALPELRPAFESAISILGKSTVEQEVVPESEAGALSERLAAEVHAHEKSAGTG